MVVIGRIVIGLSMTFAILLVVSDVYQSNLGVYVKFIVILGIFNLWLDTVTHLITKGLWYESKSRRTSSDTQ
jgi:hypothetical protein